MPNDRAEAGDGAAAGLELDDVPNDLRDAVSAALSAAGVGEGHVSVELVGAERIRELNREFRGVDEPTDVLAFPVDERGPVAGPRELGDVAICPEQCDDVTEAAVHGVLHLCGYDHEVDGGEMLALQAEVMAGLGAPAPAVAPADGGPPAANAATAAAVAGDADAAAVEAAGEAATRCGFIGLAGRPNVGKSTLVNSIVGAHIAIASVRPQTTRRAARGVATDPEAGWQLVLVDLPGVQRPRDSLTERMQRRVEHEIDDADVALLVINGEEGVGAGDRFIAGSMIGTERTTPVICVVNKLDRMSRAAAMRVLTAAAELPGVDEVFPLSALTGEGVGELVGRLAELAPPGPFMYPPEDLTDQPRETQIAELIREQVLNRTRDEIPHAVEVSILELEERDDGLLVIRAELWPETESQKGILIGRGGRKIQEVGTAARRRLEEEVGGKVHLDLQVRARPHWRRDGALLDRLGID
ncbi:MAG TPA: GTPase Era [Solirubrobacterales bacterium]|nr:GTPase Era [Solirubrobacterales bacterium]